MRNIDVCPSPELLHLYTLENKIAVVVDILRATSCMTTALAYGVEKIIPVAHLEECRQWQLQGYITAAERDAKKAEGFDLDNSPFSYMDPKLKGQTIAMTTTNGTLAITRSRTASEVIVGAFLNKKAVIKHLLNSQRDVVVVCAGWRGKFNLEDTLFAGAIVEGLKGHFSIEDDSALSAAMIYGTAKYNMIKFMAASSHVRRLHGLGLVKDIEFCLREDVYATIPILRGDALVVMEK